jgi:periplasmic divalent cation tolerance protein
MHDIVIVLTTFPADAPAAHAFARTLVEERLAACVNVHAPMTSIYRWEGKVFEDGEQLLIIKTTDERVAALREEILRRHPYSVPEFVVVPIAETSDSYGAWLLESVS